MLRIKSLAIAYGDRNIFEDVNLEFKRGTVTVIRGASGSGKSSLLHVIGLMQGPKKCNYVFDERIVSDFSENERAEFRLRHVGFVFQQSNLIQELTAKENLIVPMSITDRVGNLEQRAEELLKYVGLEKVQNNYPGSMSGGEEQRLAIVRAIANDAEIILADEPTAALDADNSKMVFELLRKLAHEMNKIVIVVSHSDVAVKYADVVCEIKDRGVVVTKSLDGVKEVTGGSSPDKVIKKRKQWRFVRYYTKKRSGDKALNRVFVAVTALVAAATILATNFGANYANEQAKIISAIADRSILVINNTLNLGGKNGQIDYEEALTISSDTISQIEALSGVKSVQQWYSFVSDGVDVTKLAETANIRISSGATVVANKSYSNSFLGGTENKFKLCPMFLGEEDDSVMASLLYQSEVGVMDGIILSYALASELTDDVEGLIGRRIDIVCFAPIKYAETYALDENGVQVKTRLVFYSLVTVSNFITGVVSDTASAWNYSHIDEPNYALISSARIMEIINANKNSSGIALDPTLTFKEIGPSALVVFTDDYQKVRAVSTQIEKISTSFSVVNHSTDSETINKNNARIRNVLLAVSVAFILIVSIMFGLLYFMKNRARRREIGILKAMGFTKTNILMLTSTEMLMIALPAFIISIVLAVGGMFLGNFLSERAVFSVTPLSVIVGLLVCVVVVIVAGVLPSYGTAKVDPVEAIRTINK